MRAGFARLLAAVVGRWRSHPQFMGDHDPPPPATEIIWFGPDALTEQFPTLDPTFTYRPAEGDLVRPYYWMTEDTTTFRRIPVEPRAGRHRRRDDEPCRCSK